MSTTTPNGDATGAAARLKIKSVMLTSTSSSSDYSNLKQVDEDYPTLISENQVIIRVKAAGLNFVELMQRQGLYKPSAKTPFCPGHEASGVIEVVSPTITDLKVGDRVIVIAPSGTWKEVILANREQVAKIPDEMPFEEAAGLAVNYLTAYQILFRMCNLREGQSVLVHAAAGGVGIAATQLCKTVPNVTIFGTCSSGKLDSARENGVDYPIDNKGTNYIDEIKKISPAGVDIVLDGLNGEHSISGYNLLKPLGRIIHFGASSMSGEKSSIFNAIKSWYKCLSLNSLDIISHNKMIGGYHLGVLMSQPDYMKTLITDLNTIIDMYVAGKIKLKIDSTFSYSKIGEGMKRLHTRQNIGKIILKPDSEFPIASTPAQCAMPVVPISTEDINLATTTTTTTTNHREQTTVQVSTETPKIEITVSAIPPNASEQSVPENVQTTQSDLPTVTVDDGKSFAEAVKEDNVTDETATKSQSGEEQSANGHVIQSA